MADGMQVEISQQSRATVVASDSALALASREIFAVLRLGVPEDAQLRLPDILPLEWQNHAHPGL